MREQDVALPLPDVDPEPSIEDFIRDGNRAERGLPLEPVAPFQDAGDTGAAVAAGESSTAVSTDPPKPDKRTREGRLASLQADFDALTRDKHQAERDLAARKAELAALDPGVRAAAPASATAPAAPVPARAVADPEPVLDDFQSDPDPYTSWLRATQRWDTRQELAKYEAAQRQQAQQTKFQSETIERAKAHDARYAAAVAADPTFVTQLSPQITAMRPLSALRDHEAATADNAIAEEILRSDLGPALMVKLSDPDTYRRLATLPTGMTPADHALFIIREMAKLETEVRLTAASLSSPASRPRVISAAKPPPKLVGTSPVVSDDGEDEGELDTDEFIRRANARDRAHLQHAAR